MKSLCFALIVLGISWIGVAWAKESNLPNPPYIQTGCQSWGEAYARCVPSGDTGSEGTTKIYKVGKETDTLIETYPWYSRQGVRFMWSPLVGGKLCVLRGATDPVDPADPDSHVEFSLFAGGELVRSVTARDLKALGAKDYHGDHGGKYHVTNFSIGDAEQVPKTNDYDFLIHLEHDLEHAPSKITLKFDILKGENIRP